MKHDEDDEEEYALPEDASYEIKTDKVMCNLVLIIEGSVDIIGVGEVEEVKVI